MKYELPLAHTVAWMALLVLSEHAVSLFADALLTTWATAHICRAAYVFGGALAKDQP